ncbi:serine hydrolase domain-containing protein [Massilia niabensis]|uniref:Serine hydrolase domain-containing protein n=1 Tax=Massilia niabensis TaxID=544910 RepID=A0ABW0L8X6_9BURK
MRFRFFLVLITGLLAKPLWADQLDDAIVREMARRHVPGVAVVVIKDGRIVREQGYGLANVEHGVPVTPRTVFQSGSTGKTFTAALVLLLAQDGKLKLDDPVSRYLDKTPRAWDGITIRHLLTHTSGLGDPYQKIDLRKDYTDEELIALEATLLLLFAPGERFNYSNAGYHLLGFIANKAGGKFWGDQVRERIFAPLGMGARVISEADIVPHRAAGYEWADGKLKNQDWVSPSLNRTADGTIHLTAHDLALWAQALDGDKILDARLRDASFTPPRLADGRTGPYGFGWYIGSQNGRRTILHGGAWQGFKTIIQRYVDDKLTVIVLANSKNARQGRIADMIAAHYVPALAIVRSKPISDTEPGVTARARAAIGQLAANQMPEGLSESERKRFTPQWIKIVADELTGAGPLASVDLLARASEDGKQRFRYRFSFRDETMIVSLLLGPKGSIDSLGISLE